MKISIVQNGRVLREHRHNSETYAEAPPTGDYVVRLANDSPSRRLAVLSVDGINVLDGSDAGYGGPGYVLRPWETVDVPGWRRTGQEVARFAFQEQSYAAQTGRGTNNVGVVGVAVFDEKVQPAPIVIREEHHHYPRPWPRRTWSMCGGFESPIRSRVTLSANEPCAQAVPGEVCHSAEVRSVVGQPVDVGTSYGQAATFHTTDVPFERASTTPAQVLTLRYATRERLRSWGVPVDESAPTKPQAFPAATTAACPPPPGWRG